MNHKEISNIKNMYTDQNGIRLQINIIKTKRNPYMI